MNHGPAEPSPPAAAMSNTFDPVAGLLRLNLLDPPHRPGELASLGPIDLVRWLGAGGMGTVFLGRDSRNDAWVAVKCLRPEIATTPRALHLFRNEIRHTQGLSHPHILPVLEVVERPAGICCVTPYMERGSLAHRIEPGTPLPVPEALRVAQQVASALAYAHGKGIIHRDLKPGNVLLDREGNACLSDFGLVRTVFNDTMLDVGASSCEGTPAYMSPRVAGGEAEDTRCDVYSFGAVLYEMLSGLPPYSGDRPEDVLARVRAGPPRALAEVQPDTPVGLVRIVEGAMARELRDRYATMDDVVEDLARVERGQEPIGPHATPRRAARRLRFGSRPAGIAAAVLLLATAALAALWWAGVIGQPRLRLAWTIEPLHPAAEPKCMLGHHDSAGTVAIFQMLDGTLHARSGRGEHLQSWDLRRVSPSAGLALLANVDEDPREELFLTWSEEDRMHAAVMNRSGLVLRRFEAQGSITRENGNVMGQSKFDALAPGDIDGDGRTELLAASVTGIGRNPRALHCFDFDAGTQKWMHAMAPFVRYMRAADVDGDGQFEVLSGSYAPGNRNSLPDGTSDANAYVFALRGSSGQLIWRKALGGYTTEVEPLFTGTSGLLNGVMTCWRSGLTNNEPGLGGLWRCSAAGKELARHEHPVALLSCLLTNLTEGLRLIATDASGRLLSFDPVTLAMAREQAIAPLVPPSTRIELVLHALADADGDGREELLLTSTQRQHVEGDNIGRAEMAPNVEFFRDSRVWVCDLNLRPRASFLVSAESKRDPDFRLWVRDLDDDGAPEILLQTDRLRVLRYRRGIL